MEVCENTQTDNATIIEAEGDLLGVLHPDECTPHKMESRDSPSTANNSQSATSPEQKSESESCSDKQIQPDESDAGNSLQTVKCITDIKKETTDVHDSTEMLNSESACTETRNEPETQVVAEVKFVEIKEDMKQEAELREGVVSLEYRAAVNEESSENSSSSSSECESDAEDSSEEDKGKKMTGKTDAESNYVIKTKGELGVEDLPPIDSLQITVPENVQMEKVGHVSSVVGTLVVVQANPGSPALNMETVLFLDNRIPMGRVFEVFGPVTSPYYSIRFNNLSEIDDRKISAGNAVFYAPKEPDFTNYVFLEELRRMKGSDASWEHNNEPPVNHLDYSDDEQERSAKKQLGREKHGEKQDGNEEVEQKKSRKRQRKKHENSSQKNDAAVNEMNWQNQRRQGSGEHWGANFTPRGPFPGMRGKPFSGPTGPFRPSRNPWSGTPMQGGYPGAFPQFGRPPFDQNPMYRGERPFGNNMNPSWCGFSPYPRPMAPPMGPFRHEMSGNPFMNTQHGLQSFSNHSSNDMYRSESGYGQNVRQNYEPTQQSQITDRRFIKNNT